MDAMTSILDLVHLTGSIYCRSELRAPWGMALPPGPTASFHVVRRGRCYLRLKQDPSFEPVLLEVGDVVLLPHGTAHVLAAPLDAPATPLAELLACRREQERSGSSPEPLTYGGTGARTTLICGYFAFDEGVVHPLLAVLPPVIVVGGEGGHASSWLESTLDLISEESTATRPGSESLINRLTEALFILVVRAHLESLEGGHPSWLLGLRDARIARALGSIHQEPQRRWTVQDLANRALMSRTAFSERFRQLVGEPPLHYLTRWRMQLAANQLRDESKSMIEVAEAVGYRAEASFSRTFKRLWGVPPGVWRREEVTARTAESRRRPGT